MKTAPERRTRPGELAKVSARLIRTPVYALLTACLILILPATGLVQSAPSESTAYRPAQEALPMIDKQRLSSIQSFLARHECSSGDKQARISSAILASARKHDLDPRLIASIVVVESRCEPFAISSADSVGIMQVHVPTWAPLIEAQNLNVFNVEDGIELGTRILKSYTSRFGLWPGVQRYKGFLDTPESQQDAADYLSRIQTLFADSRAR